MTTNLLYHFPRTRFVDENSLAKQTSHILTEIGEVFDELKARDTNKAALEVMDIYHSCETALRILEEKHGVNIMDLMFKVAAKNEARGYYAD